MIYSHQFQPFLDANMKALVKTLGSYMIMDISQRNNIVEAERPSVIEMTAFMHHRSAVNQIQVIEKDLPEDATDENFLSFWKDAEGDEKLAVESFMSQFSKQDEEK